MENVEEGDMVRLGATGTDGVVDVSHWLVAHTRRGDPKLVMVVPFSAGCNINDLNMELDSHGKIRFAMLSEVVRQFWDKRVKKIHVSPLVVQSSLVSCAKVTVTKVGALHEITWGEVVVPVVAPAAAGDVMVQPLPPSLVQLGHRIDAGFEVQQGDYPGIGRKSRRRRHAFTASGSEGSSSDSSTDMLHVLIDEVVRRAAAKSVAAKRKRGGSKADADAMAAADDGKGAREVASEDEHAEAKGKVARSKGVPRQSRQIWWHGWQLAPLKVGGWGAVCKCHKNRWDSEATVCKKQVTSGTGPHALNDEECRARVKQWLLEGLQIDSSRPDA
eukprot:11216696-Lingulodinium_polyedra.AAC.1